jgi:hypothetical protein
LKLFLKTVTDAIKRIDHVERVVGPLEFLAQTLDVAVDCAVIELNLIIVSGIHQSVATFDHAGTCGERLQVWPDRPASRSQGTSNNDDFVVGLSAAAMSLLIWRGCASASCARRPIQGASGGLLRHAMAIRSSVTSRRML